MYITQLFPAPLNDNLASRRLDESLLLEDPVYRGAKSAAQVIVEYKLTQKQILDLFAGIEKQITSKDTGANRTALGRGKDIAGKGISQVTKLVGTAVNAIQNNETVRAVDAAYDTATDALGDMVGGQDGRIMGAIKKYRMLAKEYPKTAGLAKAALVTIAGLATGGAAAPAIAAFIYGLDSAIKGERASDIVLKAGTAAALAWGAQKIAGAFQGGDTASGVTRTSEIPYEVRRTGLTGDYGMPTYDIIPGSGGAAGGVGGGAGGGAAGSYSIPGGDNIFGQAAFDQDFATATGGAIDEPLKQGITVKCPLGSCNGNVWQVQPGQSITDIADQIGVTPEQIARLNPELAGLGELTQYTVKANDVLSKIALDNKVEIREILGLNPQLAQLQGASAGQLANPDVLKPGMELVLPPPHQGSVNIYAGMSGTSADTMAQIGAGNMPDSAISQAMTGKTQAGPELLGGPGDTAAAASDAGGAATAPQTIDYTKPGPMSTDSMGTKLEYGIPVNNKGAFVPPNPSLPADELAKQTAAYDSWKADYMKRFPNAIQLPDGTMQGIKPGLAPMYPGMASGLPPGLTPKAGALPESVYTTVKLKTLPANQLIDQKMTTLSWALNESVGRPQGRAVHLTSRGINMVFENIQTLAELDKVPTPAPTRGEFKSGSGEPTPLLSPAEMAARAELPDLYRPDAPEAPVTPADPATKGAFGRGLDFLGRAAGKVGSALGTVGRQFTTKITKEKLKMDWQLGGGPSESDQLSSWLVGRGVPREAVDTVYSAMGIPVAPVAPGGETPAPAPGGETPAPAPGGETPAPAPAPAPTPGPAPAPAPTPGPELKTADDDDFADELVNPKTGKEYTRQELRDLSFQRGQAAPGDTPAADADAATTTGGAGAGVFGNMASQLASRPTMSSTGGTTTGVSGVVRHTASATNPNRNPTSATAGATAPAVPDNTATLPDGGGAGVKAAANNPFGLAGAKKPATPKEAPVAEVSRARRIAEALAMPVNKMLCLVETKDDVKRIKNFIDQTFIKYNAVDESAMATRKRLIEHVTYHGALQRREYARKLLN